jgi:hypothetical protein
MVALAYRMVRTTQGEVRQNTLKAFREVQESRVAIQATEEIVALRRDAARKAITPDTLKNRPRSWPPPSRAPVAADYVTTDLACRTAHAKVALHSQP